MAVRSTFQSEFLAVSLIFLLSLLQVQCARCDANCDDIPVIPHSLPIDIVSSPLRLLARCPIASWFPASTGSTIVAEERAGSKASFLSLWLLLSTPFRKSVEPAAPSSSSAKNTITMETNDAMDMNGSEEMRLSCPTNCFRPNPVCGVDGHTYWCGVLDAKCGGVEVEYEGFCEFRSRETGGRDALAVQSFLLLHNIWLVLTACLVFLGVP